MAFQAGGIAPNTPSSNPVPHPTKIATLSTRSANAPIVNRTAVPLITKMAMTAATNEADVESNTAS